MEEAERSLFEAGLRLATERFSGKDLDSALFDLGWRDGLEADPFVAVSVLFEAQGSTNARSAAFDVLLASTLDPHIDGHPSVVLPPLRNAVAAPGRIDGGQCMVQGLGASEVVRADVAIVVATTGDSHVALTVDPKSLDLHPVKGLDPDLGLVRVDGIIDLDGTGPGAPVDWEAALALGRLALGHELVGVGRGMLELARLHALERVQFGRPISSFQAVRHRLAECKVMIEAATELLAAAWIEPSADMAGMAKAFAGRSTRTVARHAQQVLAGVGFTTEHPLHRYVRRAIALDQLLGAGTLLTRRLGEDVLTSGSLPPIFGL